MLRLAVNLCGQLRLLQRYHAPWSALSSMLSTCRPLPALCLGGCQIQRPLEGRQALQAMSRAAPSHPAVRSEAAVGHLQQAHRQQNRRQQQRWRHHLTTAMAGSVQEQGGQSKVLFVCLGNICRSPSAEAVFKNVVECAGVSSQFVIDSCGTGGGSSNWYMPGGFSYHEGDPPDSRMTTIAQDRGITLTSRSRPLTPSDLAEFDHIIGMDAANLAAIRCAAEHWRANGHGSTVPDAYASKLSLMTDFLRNQQFSGFREVPDPYYGGQKGFELVLDLLDDACQGLLDSIQNRGR